MQYPSQDLNTRSQEVITWEGLKCGLVEWGVSQEMGFEVSKVSEAFPVVSLFYLKITI